MTNKFVWGKTAEDYRISLMPQRFVRDYSQLYEERLKSRSIYGVGNLMKIPIRKILLLPDRFYNLLLLKLKCVQYGFNLNINGKISLHGNGKIIVGNNVTINSTPYINPMGCGTQTFLQTEKNGVLQIGNNVGISHSAITAFEGVIIEDNVLIGSGCKIFDTDFHSIEYNNRMKHPDTHIAVKPVKIEEGAFIGAMSIITKGVTIGRRSVIGAGSVVTHNIPNDEMWAGNPARFIKKLETNKP